MEIEKWEQYGTWSQGSNTALSSLNLAVFGWDLNLSQTLQPSSLSAPEVSSQRKGVWFTCPGAWLPGSGHCIYYLCH